MSNLSISFNAVFPFLFYLTFGYFAVKKGFADIPFMNRLNQMIFKLFFPLLMFTSIYKNGEESVMDYRIILICVFSILIVIAVSWLVVPMILKENPQRGVIIQAIYRTNTVLFAIPLTQNIFGEDGVAIASMVVAVLVPVYNMMAVVILEYYRGGKVKFPDMLRKILSNPLIMGAIAALICNHFRIRIPGIILKPVSQFSSMTTPLALFILGGTLKFSSVKKNMKLLSVTLFIKMILLPGIAIMVSILLGMSSLERFEYFTLFAAPIAVSSYTMAQNMGGDGDLAGELVIFSTVLSIITLFLWIFFMKSTGLI